MSSQELEEVSVVSLSKICETCAKNFSKAVRVRDTWRIRGTWRPWLRKLKTLREFETLKRHLERLKRGRKVETWAASKRTTPRTVPNIPETSPATLWRHDNGDRPGRKRESESWYGGRVQVLTAQSVNSIVSWLCLYECHISASCAPVIDSLFASLSWYCLLVLL